MDWGRWVGGKGKPFFGFSKGSAVELPMHNKDGVFFVSVSRFYRSQIMSSVGGSPLSVVDEAGSRQQQQEGAAGLHRSLRRGFSQTVDDCPYCSSVSQLFSQRVKKGYNPIMASRVLNDPMEVLG